MNNQVDRYGNPIIPGGVQQLVDAAGVLIRQRPFLRMVSGATAVDNDANNSTDVTFAGGAVTLAGDVTGPSGTNVVASISTHAEVAGDLIATAIAEPGTPVAGKGTIYEDSTTKLLSIKDDAGVVSSTVVNTAAGRSMVGASTAVAQAALLGTTIPTAGTNIADGATASISIAGGSHYVLPTLTQNIVVTLATTGSPLAGLETIVVDVTRTSAFTVTFKDDAGTTLGVAIPASVKMTFTAKFDGTHYASPAAIRIQ